MKMNRDRHQEIIEAALAAGITDIAAGELPDIAAIAVNLPEEILRDLRYAWAMAIRLPDPVVESVIDKPSELYSFWYRRANYLLDQAALKVAGLLANIGARALPIPSSQIVHWEKQYGHFPHRAAAVAAGLGWRGRNNLLVHRKYGSRVRLSTVLTDAAPFEMSAPLAEDCGECINCLPECPAGAIGMSWTEWKGPECYAKLREFSKIPLIGQYICGICVKACGPREQNGGER